MTEDELIAEIQRRVGIARSTALEVGIGDDAAVWQPSRGNRSVITTDVLVENVHFSRNAMDAEDVGWRALAANLSDIAAMGARPVLATIALGFPQGTDPTWLLRCYDGLALLANRARCAVAGGDLSRAPAVMLSITIVGEVRASNLKLRRDARPGDVIAVTGPLGASRAGLRIAMDRPDLAGEPAFAPALEAFRRPEPRLREGRWLGASRSVHALMDLSDGLSTDLARVCAASGVGATIEHLPVHDAARAIATRTGDDVEAWALGGGEDFELLVTIGRSAFAHLATRFRAHFRRELLRVGTMVAGEGVRRPDGVAVAPSGWDHLR